MNASLRIVNFESRVTFPTGTFRIRADFEVEPDARLALYSPSGSGKTTLLRWIAGVSEDAAEGKLFYGSEEIGNQPPERREIGVVFQDYALFPNRSALENVAFGLEMRGASLAARKASALEWLAKFDLAGRAMVPAGLLSGGEKQRVALARALIWEPKALLLDEPFAALDLVHRKAAREEIKSLLIANPIPTLFITHDPEDVAEFATRTLGYRETDGGLTHTFES